MRHAEHLFDVRSPFNVYDERELWVATGCLVRVFS